MQWDFYLVTKLAGIAVFIFFGGRAASRQLGIPLKKALFLNFWAVAAAFLASRTWYILQNDLGKFRGVYDFPEIFDYAGSVLYGWILGGTAAIWLLTRWQKLPFIRYIDAVAPWMLITQFLNRLGCYDAGCCFGKPGHPVQLYEAAFDLALFAFIKTRKPRVGLTTVLYFTGYPIGRFFLEFFRGDNKPALWFMTVPQVASVLILIILCYNWRNLLKEK